MELHLRQTAISTRRADTVTEASNTDLPPLPQATLFFHDVTIAVSLEGGNAKVDSK